MKKKPIYVTQPSMPPLEEFIPYLEQIWSSKILTNNGQFHQQLEKELCDYLGVQYISLFANGTLALTTALQALQITDEVITTPYSFVASSHALLWNSLKPVFVDIERETCNINADNIEAAITSKTRAILPVHVYGNPCNCDKIQKIAEKYNLKVIYDAAHAFGVKYKDHSILNAGDLSILSFHATKVFTTFEGGAIVSHSAEMKQHIDDLKNFGFRDELTIVAPGINAKMNELQAAMGLLQLKYIDTFIEKRKHINELYRMLLKDINGVRVLPMNPNVQYNYSYFPIFVDEKTFSISRDKLYEKMKANNIYGRRYFFPLISKFSIHQELLLATQSNLSIAEEISNRVLCLPIFPDMQQEDILNIVNLIKHA